MSSVERQKGAAGHAVRGTAGNVGDADLVRRMRGGDQAAFAALVSRYGGALLRLARVFLHDAAAAEEVVQDTWLAVLDGIERFEERSSFKTWLFRILANRARTRATRDRRTIPFSALAPADGEEAPAVDPERFDAAGMWRDPPAGWSDETPERLALRGETRAVMEAAIAELPAAQRAVLVLRDVEGLETDEICNLLEVTVTNQRVLLHRARARVRQALERYMKGRR